MEEPQWLKQFGVHKHGNHSTKTDKQYSGNFGRENGIDPNKQGGVKHIWGNAQEGDTGEMMKGAFVDDVKEALNQLHKYLVAVSGRAWVYIHKTGKGCSDLIDCWRE